MKFGCCAGVNHRSARGGINQVFSLVAARGIQRGEPIFACAFDESAECAPCTPPFLATPFQPYRGALHPNSHCIFYIFLINKPHPPFSRSPRALFLSRSLARPHPCVIPDKKFGTQKSLPFYIDGKHTPPLGTRVSDYIYICRRAHTNFNEGQKTALCSANKI